MDKLKYIKLENPDGSYSESIPLSVDSDNVDVNGNTLTNELNNKASITNVNTSVANLQSQINSLASGAPSGVYATVAALTAADPDHNKIYIVTADGNWYYYNNRWQSGGVYEASSESTKIKNNYNNMLNDNNLVNTNYNIILPLWSIGDINQSTGVVQNSTDRIVTDFINATLDDDLDIEIATSNIKYYVCYYTQEDVFLGKRGPYYKSLYGLIKPRNETVQTTNAKIKIAASWTSGDTITYDNISSLSSKFSITKHSHHLTTEIENIKMITNDLVENIQITSRIFPEWENGNYTNNGNFESSDDKIYTFIDVDVNNDFDIIFDTNTYKVHLRFIDNNWDFLGGRDNISNMNNVINNIQSDKELIKHVCILVSYQDGSKILKKNIKSIATDIMLKYSNPKNDTEINNKMDNHIKNIKTELIHELRDNELIVYPNDSFQSVVNGSFLNNAIKNPITDLKQQGDLMVHVSSFEKINDMIYTVFSVNKHHNYEDANEYTTVLRYFSLNNPENITTVEICNIGDIIEGFSVQATCDCCIFKKPNDIDNLYIVWTIKLNGMWRVAYRVYNITQGELGAVTLCSFKKDNTTYAFKVSDIRIALDNNNISNTDICIMQKISPREENGKTYYYTGVGITKTCFVIRTEDFITWEYVTMPTFEYTPMWEPVTYVYNNKLYYFCRQAAGSSTTRYAVLASYDFETEEWSNPYYVLDSQSRGDFFVYNNKLYLMHAPKDRSHLSIIRINTSNLANSDTVLSAWVPDCFYPFSLAYDNKIYMTVTRTRQHIYFISYNIFGASDQQVMNVLYNLFQS